MAATQKDFDNVSRILSDARGRREQSRLDCLLQLTAELADYFEAENKNFDRDLFLVACQSPRPDMERIMTARRKARLAGNPGGWRNHMGDVEPTHSKKIPYRVQGGVTEIDL